MMPRRAFRLFCNGPFQLATGGGDLAVPSRLGSLLKRQHQKPKLGPFYALIFELLRRVLERCFENYYSSDS